MLSSHWLAHTVSAIALAETADKAVDPAGYDRRARAAVTLRRRMLLAAAAVGLPSLSGRAQTAAASAVAVAVRYLASSGMLQNKMSSLVASRDTEPEVKAFAGQRARAAADHLEQLRTFARARSLQVPEESPALTRRYAEVEQQAVERDVQMYEEAAKSPDAD